MFDKQAVNLNTKNNFVKICSNHIEFKIKLFKINNLNIYYEKIKLIF